MALLYLRHFTVEGRVAFPLDMLRYGRCWPSSSVDVAAMGDDRRDRLSIIEGGRRDHRRVRLSTCCVHKRGLFAERERWANFDWPVLEEEMR